MSMDRSARRELRRLLCDLFAKPRQLRRWLLQAIDDDDLDGYLPDEGLERTAYVETTLEQLESRGLIDDAFFEQLVLERPKRRAEILSVRSACEAGRRADVTRTADLRTPALKTFGNADAFKLLFKVAGDDFVKSTKAMQVEGGCLVQVSTRERGPNGWAVAEALTFVPAARIVEELDDEGKVASRHLAGLDGARP
jgi:hypothetical protein